MRTAMLAENDVVLLDTSAAIALIVEDHEAHALTLEVLRGRRLGLSGHAWFETYSVLTRLPSGLRQSPASAVKALRQVFPGSRFLDRDSMLDLGTEFARLQIAGGALFDALVGATARWYDRPLVSCDVRARRTYDALGVRVLWPIGPP
jgi:predicted nucleic acid-binding protein